MKNQNINDTKYKNYKKEHVILYFIIIFTVLTIVLGILSLFKVVSFVWCILTSLTYSILTKIRYEKFLKNNSNISKKNKKKVDK